MNNFLTVSCFFILCYALPTQANPLKKIEHQTMQEVIALATEVGPAYDQAIKAAAGDFDTITSLKTQRERFKNEVKLLIKTLRSSEEVEISAVIPDESQPFRQTFNAQLIKIGEAHIQSLNELIQRAEIDNRPGIAKVIQQKKETFLKALNNFATPDNISDQYELVFTEPLIKKYAYKELKLKDEAILTFKTAKTLPNLYLYSDQGWGTPDGTELEKLGNIHEVRFFPNLTNYSLYGQSIADHECFKFLPHLVSININSNNTETFEHLKKLKRLNRLSFYSETIHSFPFLKEMPQVKIFESNGLQLSPSTFKEDFIHITRLRLGRLETFSPTHYIGLDKLKDLSVHWVQYTENLDRCKDLPPSLTHLMLRNCKLDSLNFIAQMPHKLSSLYIDNNPITDLSPIANLKYLQTLNISSLDVKDFSPLLEMAKNGCFKEKHSQIFMTNNENADFAKGSTNHKVITALKKARIRVVTE